jgi:DNA polymerase I-like protein with 3'-5' exonuclease and polymerase domains
MKWLDEAGNRAKLDLAVRSMEGGRRRWKKPTWELAKHRANEDAKKYKRLANDDEVRRKYSGMFRSIEREGKNAGVQRTNAYIAKRAMYLTWLELEPRFGAYWLNFVHDEFVIEVPEQNAEACRDFVADCFIRAGREFFKFIDMESESQIKDFWTK